MLENVALADPAGNPAREPGAAPPGLPVTPWPDAAGTFELRHNPATGEADLEMGPSGLATLRWFPRCARGALAMADLGYARECVEIWTQEARRIEGDCDGCATFDFEHSVDPGRGDAGAFAVRLRARGECRWLGPGRRFLWTLAATGRPFAPALGDGQVPDVLDAAGVIVFEYDFEAGQATTLNRTLSLLGGDAATIGAPFMNPTDAETRARAWGAVHSGAASELSYLLRILTPDGHQRVLFTRGSVSKRSADDGRPLRLTGVSVDVSGRGDQLRQMQEPQLRFGEFANLMPVGCAVVAADGAIQWANTALQSLLGVSSIGEIAGRRWIDAFVHRDDRERVRSAWESYLAAFSSSGGSFGNLGVDEDGPGNRTGENADGKRLADTDRANAQKPGESAAFQTSLRLVTPTSQRTLHAHARLSHVGSQDAGAVTQYALVLQDVSERMASERAKDAFLASLSHEIRTPVSGIVGMLGMLQEIPLEAEQQRMVRSVQACSQQLLYLVNDILDLGKLDAGKMRVELVPVTVRACIDEAIDALTAATRERRVSITADITADVPEIILADPGRIRQLLFNLLSNATKFTPEGGAITVRVSRVTIGHLRGLAAAVPPRAAPDPTAAEAALAVVEPPESQPDDMPALFVQVRDTGIGISAAQMAHLFRSYRQADVTTTRRFGGTGLGLIICRRLVQLMDGAIGVRSTVGQGSVFSFAIPLREVHAGDASRQSDSESVPSPATSLASDSPSASRPQAPYTLKILVADDNSVTRSVLQHQLAQNGFSQVDVAIDGSAALRDALAAEPPYDLILTDVQMPIMGGIELAERLRAAAPRVVPKLVALSGRHLDDAEWRKAGIDAFLMRPWHVRDLLGVIQRLFPGLGVMGSCEGGL